MNVSKFIATLVVKNHNNGIFNQQDAIIRDRMYNRITAAIELAKEHHLEIEALEDRFVVKADPISGIMTFKDISIYKKHLHCQELADFFFGMKRSRNAIAFVSWFKHQNEDKFLYLVESNGAIGCGIASATQKRKASIKGATYHEIPA